MTRRTLLAAATAAALLPAAADANQTRPAVMTETIDYHGWDALKLSNGTVDVVVVPSIARVMYYGKTGGGDDDNVLWVNPTTLGQAVGEADDWQNFGGDKAWPWPQDQWPALFPAAWPPPEPFEGVAWEGRFDGEDSVVYTGPVNDVYRVRPVRTVTLDAEGTGVTITTEFIDVAQQRESEEAGAWHVTQIAREGSTVVAVDAASPKWMGDAGDDADEKFGRFVTPIGEGAYAVVPLDASGGKAGFDAGTLAAGMTVGGEGMVFVQRVVEAGPEGTARYLEKNDKAQVYVNGPAGEGDVPSWTELEFCGPVGDASRLSVRWELRPIDADKSADAAAVAAVARE